MYTIYVKFHNKNQTTNSRCCTCYLLIAREKNTETKKPIKTRHDHVWFCSHCKLKAKGGPLPLKSAVLFQMSGQSGHFDCKEQDEMFDEIKNS